MNMKLLSILFLTLLLVAGAVAAGNVYYSLTDEPQSDGAADYARNSLGHSSTSGTYNSKTLLVATAPDAVITDVGVYVYSITGAPAADNFIYDLLMCPTDVLSITGTTNLSYDCTGPLETVASGVNISAVYGATTGYHNITLDDPLGYPMDSSKNYLIQWNYTSGGDANDAIYNFHQDSNPTNVMTKRVVGGSWSTATALARFHMYGWADSDNDGWGVNLDCDDNNATKRPVLNGTTQYINSDIAVCTDNYVDTHIIINATGITFDGNNSMFDGTDNTGVGIYSEFDNTTIMNTKLVDYYDGIYLDGFTSDAADYGRIINNTMDSMGQYGIRFQESKYTLIENNTVTNSNTGAYIWGEGASENNTVHNNTFTQNSYGVRLVGGIIDTTITNNTLEGGSYGILVGDGSIRTIFSNNTVKSASRGFHTQGADHLTIEGNLFDLNVLGIAGVQTNGNLINNNRILNCSSYAIDLETLDNTNITYNVITNATRGMYIRLNADNNRIIGNNISDTPLGFYSLWTSPSPVFIDNIFDNTTRGVFLNGIHGATFINNTFIANSGNAFDLYNSRDGTITGGSMTNSGDAIKLRTNSHNWVINDVTITDSTNGVYVDASNNNTINNSVIVGATQDSIKAENSYYGYYENNTITGGNYGFRLYSDSDYNTVFDNSINASTYGIAVSDANSTYNNISNNRINNTVQYGVIITSALDTIIDGNILANNKAYGISTSSSTRRTQIINNHLVDNFDYGIWAYQGNDTIIDNNLVESGSSDGIITQYNDHTTITNNNVSGCPAGIEAQNGDYITGSNNTITGAWVGGITLLNINNGSFVGGSVQGTGYHVRATNTNNVSFTDLLLQNKSTVDMLGTYYVITAKTTSPPAPTGYAMLTHYFDINNYSSDAWLLLNVSYTQEEVTDAGVDEDTLSLWRNNGTWYDINGSTVEPTINKVSTNITEFSSFSLLGRSGDQYIIGKANVTAGDVNYIVLIDTSNHLCFQYTSSGVLDTICGGTYLMNNTQYTFGVTTQEVGNDTQILIYLNGSLDANSTMIGPPDTSTNPITMAETYAGGDQFYGVLDNIRIYNKALNSTEIASELGEAYAKELPRFAYDFEFGSNETAYDTHLADWSGSTSIIMTSGDYDSSVQCISVETAGHLYFQDPLIRLIIDNLLVLVGVGILAMLMIWVVMQ